MKYNDFGPTDLRVSEIGLGCARLGGVFSELTESESIALLGAAFDRGITFFDTSNMYSQGESERLLGKAFTRRRHDVVIASKVGYKLPRQRLLADRLKPLARPIVRRLKLRRDGVANAVRGALQRDFSPKAIEQAATASLRRLKTDYLDFYQLHGLPSDNLDQAIDSLESLRRRGIVRYFGVSCDEAAEASIVLSDSRVSGIQLNFSLLHQEAIDVDPALRAGVGVVTRQCFASGLLAKPILDQDFASQPAGRLAEVKACEGLAQSLGRPLMELALHFSLAAAPGDVTLVGVRNCQQLDEVIDLCRRAPLSSSELTSCLALPSGFRRIAGAGYAASAL